MGGVQHKTAGRCGPSIRNRMNTGLMQGGIDIEISKRTECRKCKTENRAMICAVVAISLSIMNQNRCPVTQKKKKTSCSLDSEVSNKVHEKKYKNVLSKKQFTNSLARFCN